MSVDLEWVVDVEMFRTGMRRLVASVCIVTCGSAEGPTGGLTATAVTSVAAQPPTLLCCINRASSSYVAVLAARRFAVNILSLHDRELALRFAGTQPVAEKFSAGSWDLQGAPLLRSAVASFDCVLTEHTEVGTHGVLFGRISALRMRDDAVSPLLYAHGNYGAFNVVS